MSSFIRLASLLLLLLVTTCEGGILPAKAHMKISNGLENGLVLNLYCQPKNNNLGVHALSKGGTFEFVFRPNQEITTIKRKKIVHKIISNGKLKGAEHREVTNSNLARTTASFALDPFYETLVEPAKTLVDASNPALYKSSYKDFLIKYRAAASYATPD